MSSTKPKKHADKNKYKSRSRYVSSSSEEDQPYVAKHRSSKPSGAQPSGANSDQDQPQHDPDPPYYREVALGDIPSQYAEEGDTFRCILSLPDPRESLPRSSTSVMGLDDEKGPQELRPRGPSSMLPLSCVIKDAFDKFEHDFKAANLPEGKYIKPPPATTKWYKVGQPCYEEKMQELNTRRKAQNGNSRVHQDLPDSRGMGIVDISVGRLPAHLHPSRLKEIPKALLQVTGVPVHLPPIRTSHSPLQRTQASRIPGRLADQVPVSGGSPSEHSGGGRPNPVLGLDNKSGKIRTKTYLGVFVRGLRIPSRFSPCKTHSREMAQTSGFDPTTQVKMCFDCKMFDVANWVACPNRENGPGGTPSHEALLVSPQGALEISSITGQPPSLDRSHCSTPRLVAKSLKRDERCRTSFQRPQYPTLYRRLK